MSFNATNRFRQGDPLAPCLFLIGTEGLSRLLRKETEDGNLTPAIKNGVEVSRILFSNDVLIFAKADTTNATTVNNKLKYFVAISSLEMNPDKNF